MVTSIGIASVPMLPVAQVATQEGDELGLFAEFKNKLRPKLLLPKCLVI